MVGGERPASDDQADRQATKYTRSYQMLEELRERVEAVKEKIGQVRGYL